MTTRRRQSMLGSVATRLIPSDGTGTFHFLHTQDCEPIIDGVKAAGEIYSARQKGSGRYAGTLPLVVGQLWAKEWGVRMYSQEWIKLARKRMNDPEYKKLLVNYK